MTDKQIIKLYFERNENAITETDNKYGRYLFKIAYNLLANREDSKESVNDTYLKTWNSVPPNNPEVLSVYLTKLLRGTAIDVLRGREAAKRKASAYSVSLEELAEYISGMQTTEDASDMILLTELLNRFVSKLPEEKRNIFILRYYYGEPLRLISAYCKISLSKTKTLLFRIKEELKEYLEKEDFFV